MPERVVITGAGAICAAGADPASIWDAVSNGRTAIQPMAQWAGADPSRPLAAAINDFSPAALVPDRKLHKLIRRSDFFGLFAAAQAIDGADVMRWRDGLTPNEREGCGERWGVFVGSGGGTYQNQHDFLPLLARAGGAPDVFGRELTRAVHPMFLLRTLPNNVLCHLGVRYGFKGPNACITNHSVSGALAISEAVAALREGSADRAVVVAHDAPIEPQTVLYYQRLGLLAREAVRPFDTRREGCALGEGAAALLLETAAAARAHPSVIRGEILGSGCATEGEGVLAVRADGDGMRRAIRSALDDAGRSASHVGLIVAHGNATQQSDPSEARAIRAVFGPTPPPVTAFKWALGHLLAASAALDVVLALEALRHRSIPGIATLSAVAPECAGLPVSSAAQAPRSDIALVLSRGFGSMNAAVLVQGGNDACR